MARNPPGVVSAVGTFEGQAVKQQQRQKEDHGQLDQLPPDAEYSQKEQQNPQTAAPLRRISVLLNLRIPPEGGLYVLPGEAPADLRWFLYVLVTKAQELTDPDDYL